MLKIVDNVDLKELEKYGLKLRYKCNEDNGTVYVTDIYKTRNDYHNCIRFQAFPECFELVYIETQATNILYDLIKDGLVEKVEE